MKITLSCLVFLVIMTSCSGNNSTTTYSTGPSLNIADVAQVGIYLNSDGEFVVDGDISVPIVPIANLGSLNWNFAFETVSNNLQSKNNHLVILWQDDESDILEQDYSLNQPFQINFSKDEWVKYISYNVGGNIIVSVEKQMLEKTYPPTAIQQQTGLQPISIDYSCSDKDQVELQVGAWGKVGKYDLNLREDPVVPNDWGANVIRVLHTDEHIFVVGGPVCAYDGTWWQIKTESSDIGWSRELEASKGRLLIRVNNP